MKLLVVVTLVILGFLCGQSQADSDADFHSALKKVWDAVGEARKGTREVVQAAIGTFKVGLAGAQGEVGKINIRLLEEIDRLQVDIDVPACTNDKRIAALQDWTLRKLETVVGDATDGLTALEAAADATLQVPSDAMDGLLKRHQYCLNKVAWCNSIVLKDTLAEVPKQLISVSSTVGKCAAGVAGSTAATTSSIAAIIGEFTKTTNHILVEVEQCINNQIQV